VRLSEEAEAKAAQEVSDQSPSVTDTPNIGSNLVDEG
jgi:hypothetical protein